MKKLLLFYAYVTATNTTYPKVAEKNCVFPFRYKGVEHSACISADQYKPPYEVNQTEPRQGPNEVVKYFWFIRLISKHPCMHPRSTCCTQFDVDRINLIHYWYA